jgi:hypothetical protein
MNVSEIQLDLATAAFHDCHLFSPVHLKNMDTSDRWRSVFFGRRFAWISHPNADDDRIFAKKRRHRWERGGGPVLCSGGPLLLDLGEPLPKSWHLPSQILYSNGSNWDVDLAGDAAEFASLGRRCVWNRHCSGSTGHRPLNRAFCSMLPPNLVACHVTTTHLYSYCIRLWCEYYSFHY